MRPLIHLALDRNSVVIAHFLRSNDANTYCQRNKLCHVPFNPANAQKEPVPQVGAQYVVNWG